MNKFKFTSCSQKFSLAILVSLLTLIFVMVEASAQHKNGFATVTKVVNLFSVWSDDELDPAIAKELSNYIDYEEMSQRALGANWHQLSKLERKEYVFVFRKLVEEKYYKRWRKILSKGKLSKLKEVETKDSIYVKTRFSEDDEDETMVFRVSKKTKLLKIISISVGKKDLLTRVTARIQKHLKKQGFDKLIAWMKDKADIESPKSLKSTAAK